MFRSRARLPVSPEQQEWIEESFKLLIRLFGEDWVKNAPLVLPNKQFFNREWVNTEDWARYAFGTVCELMQVQRGRIDLHFQRDGWEELRQAGLPVGWTRGAAGLYRQIPEAEGPSSAEITIKHSLINEPESMVATMSHELAHVLLLGDGKIDRDMERMEPLTDLMTVFSGFGIFTANSAHVHRSNSRGWHVSNKGYLNQREYGYAMAVWAWQRGEQAPSWKNELTKNVRTFMSETLAHFKSTKRPS